MDVPEFPPTDPAADETVVTDGAAFATCEMALQAFASRGSATVTDRQYSLSPEWGHVLWATVALPGVGVSAIPVVLSSKPGEGVAMFVDMYRPGR
jgi:hypothetical protein